MLLSEPDDFSGGGTYFEQAGRVYRPSRGVGVVHSALVRHAGYPIDGGVRYVLVGFCGLRSRRLPADFDGWRFGEPSWFVSSRVVGDGQILRRVWPQRGQPALAQAELAGEEDGVVAGEWEEEEWRQEEGDELEEEHAAAATAADEAEELPSSSSPGASTGEKPWYRKQHDLAAISREEGKLVFAEAYAEAAEESPAGAAGGALAFEMWRNGDDLVAMLTSSGRAAESAAQEGREASVEVIASVTFRDGPLPPELLALLRALVPSAAPAARSTGWVARARERLASRVRGAPRMTGIVHVYVLPEWRGAGRGEEMMRRALSRLKAEGLTYVLTLADDRGSGKLREWYEELGFVDASAFDDTAMVARV